MSILDSHVLTRNKKYLLIGQLTASCVLDEIPLRNKTEVSMSYGDLSTKAHYFLKLKDP